MVAAIVLNPTHAAVGTSVLITGSGFALTSAITFKYAGVTIVATDGPITSDGTGAFTAHITIPASVQGVHAVQATDASAGTASANFTVDAAVSLSVATGPVGTSVTLNGTGFATLSAMSFTFGDVAIVPQGGAVTTDALGNFSAILVIPSSSIGSKNIVSTDGSSNSVTNAFTVTGVNTIALTTVTNPAKYLKSYKYGSVAVEVNDDSYDDVGVIDMRGCTELDVQIFNTGGSNGLTYALYGRCDETESPGAYDTTHWSAVSGATGNVAALANTIVQITQAYSWILVRVKRQTSGQDTTLTCAARQKQ